MAIGFLGIGSYVPERVVTNDEIAELVPDTTPEWVLRKTGIATRRWAAPGEATSDLAAEAARRALTRAGLSPGRIDYLIVATSTGDHPQPPTACLVQHLIGAHAAACFDVNAVCAGFVYGVELARTLTTARPDTHALVIGADVYSRILDLTDRRTAVLMADGAGAAVIGRVPDDEGILHAHLAGYGESQDLIKVVAGGSRVPTTVRTAAGGMHYFTMRGRGVRDFVLQTLPPLLAKLITEAGLSLHDVDCFIPHQANGVLLRELAQRCGLDGAHTHLVVDRYGNAGSASVPVALDDAVTSGAVPPGGLVLLAGFGGGMSVGASLIRWPR
jgi:3-oxoacyl-[acyl-carrier-protein] synthase-3